MTGNPFNKTVYGDGFVMNPEAPREKPKSQFEKRTQQSSGTRRLGALDFLRMPARGQADTSHRWMIGVLVAVFALGIVQVIVWATSERSSAPPAEPSWNATTQPPGVAPPPRLFRPNEPPVRPPPRAR